MYKQTKLQLLEPMTKINRAIGQMKATAQVQTATKCQIVPSKATKRSLLC